jgi:hypothetical protein
MAKKLPIVFFPILFHFSCLYLPEMGKKIGKITENSRAI